MAKNKVPLVPNLFTFTDTPHLLASHCKKCGSYSFPKSAYCTNPDCPKDLANVEIVELSNKAKIYTWTVQVYPPSLPFKMDPFTPFPIGMLDFPEGIRILGMLTTEKVDFGTEMEMTTKKLYEDGNNEYYTWVWKPAGK